MDLLAKFDDAARGRVGQAIRDAETKTKAEILPVVAKSSGTYDRAEDIVGLWFGGTAVGVAWLFQGVSNDATWSGAPEIRIGFWILLAIFVVGFIVGVVCADRIVWLRRLFIPSTELEARTRVRSKTVFFDRRLHLTSGRTGVLLFVSLFERRVVVLADESVAEALSERDLEEVRDEILGGLKEQDLCKALVKGVQRIGNLLGTPLPAEGDRVDEIPSEVVILD
ncbi:MAG: hypothetical protein AAF517_00835 [Planctomycetota bacterium]